MFSKKYQGNFDTVYYSIGSNPLANWSVKCKKGEFQQVLDNEINSNVLQILSQNVVACSMTSPVNPRGSLGIRLPHFSMQVKYMDTYFMFEVTILDSNNIRRRVRVNNFQSIERLDAFSCTKHISLKGGWVQLNLDFTSFIKNNFNTTFVEVVQIQVHANCRLRRIFFSDRQYTNQELPNDYQLNSMSPVRAKPANRMTKKRKPVGGSKTKTASVAPVFEIPEIAETYVEPVIEPDVGPMIELNADVGPMTELNVDV